MNLITPPVKRPTPLLPCLLLGLVFVAGCDATKPSVITAPTTREAELTKTVAELRGKLAAAEQATEQAKAQAAVALAQSKNTPAPQAKAEPAAATPQGTDTAYVVAKKTFTPGELIPAATGAYPNATERRPAEYWITFKGVQSGKEYPALAVKDTAYSDFREGVDYTQQDINQAKITSPASDATGTPLHP